MTPEARHRVRSVLLFAGLSVLCQDLTPALSPGKFLVAARQLQDPNFAETVVLIVRHGEGGAVGLIVNRPLPFKLAAIVPDVEGPGGEQTAYLGGPVSLDVVTLLVRSATPLEQAEPVLDDVHFSRDARLLERLAREPRPRFRAYLGYAGWAPGQLEDEVLRGDWRIVRADAASVFDVEPESLWRMLLPRDPSRSTRRRPSRTPSVPPAEPALSPVELAHGW